MPRQPKPFVFKSRYWVTKAGGRGIKILCDLDPKLKDQGAARAERELRRYLLQLERDEQTGATSTSYTVAQLIGEFLELYSHTRPEKTLKHYQWTLGELAKRFGPLKVSDLTEAHANQYIVELTRGQAMKEGKRKLGEATDHALAVCRRSSCVRRVDAARCTEAQLHPAQRGQIPACIPERILDDGTEHRYFARDSSSGLRPAMAGIPPVHFSASPDVPPEGQ